MARLEFAAEADRRGSLLVAAFHAAALAARGRANGARGLRSHYHANYGAFISTRRHNVELVRQRARSIAAPGYPASGQL